MASSPLTDTTPEVVVIDTKATIPTITTTNDNIKSHNNGNKPAANHERSSSNAESTHCDGDPLNAIFNKQDRGDKSSSEIKHQRSNSNSNKNTENTNTKAKNSSTSLTKQKRRDKDKDNAKPSSSSSTTNHSPPDNNDDDDDDDDNADIRSNLLKSACSPSSVKACTTKIMLHSNDNMMMSEIGGREAIFAILVFTFMSIALGMAYVIGMNKMQRNMNLRTIENLTLTLEKCGEWDPRDDVCLLKECMKASAEMLSKMNRDANPCNDFWNYACGGWLKQNEIPPSRESWAVDDQRERETEMHLKSMLERPIERTEESSVERKMKSLYSRCMDEDTLEDLREKPLHDVIDGLGGWAITDDWNIADKSGMWKFQTALEELHFKYFVEVLFTFSVSPDMNNSDVYVLKLDQSGLGMDRTDYSLNRTHPKVTAYKQFMRKIAELYGATKESAASFAESNFEFESKLAAIHNDDTMSMSMAMNPVSSMQNVTLSELQMISPAINWKSFLRRGLYVTSSSHVLISNRDYFRKISDLISSAGPRELNLYMLWRLASHYSAQLSREFRDANHKFKSLSTGASKGKDRWQVCLSVVGDWFSMGLGALFVQNYFSPQSKHEVEEMIQHIQETFKKSLDQNDWMDEETKTAAIKKLNAMKYHTGYPDYMLDEAKIDNLYGHFEIGDNDTYFQMHINGASEEVRKMSEALERNAPENDIWEVPIHEANAYYAYTVNTMVFPAGIMQSPYYIAQAPRYINYASLGSIIGHELVHGFDNMGSTMDENGNQRSWWTYESRDNFENRTSCLVDYYSKYRVNGEHVNGRNTLGENLADITGITTAYRSYKEWEQSKTHWQTKTAAETQMPGLDLNNDQVFFLAWAQNWCGKRRPESMSEKLKHSHHAPGEIRVKGALSQVPAFGEVFACENFQNMQSSVMCEVW